MILHKLAKALLIYETLSGDEIRDLILKILNLLDHLKKKMKMMVKLHQHLGSLGLKPKPAI